MTNQQSTISDAFNVLIKKSSQVVPKDGLVDESTLYEISDILNSLIKIIATDTRKLNKESPLYIQAMNLQIHLLSTFKYIQVAYKKNDTIMLQDLLINDLKDNLLQWKVNIMPYMKDHIA